MGFGLVWFYGMSNIVGYLMPNSLYTYTLNIWDLYTHFVDNILNEPKLIFLHTVFNGFKYFYLTRIINHFLHPVKWF